MRPARLLLVILALLAGCGEASPTTSVFERSLSFQDSGEGWLHLFSRPASSISVGVRVLKWNLAVAPPVQDVTLASLPPSGCRDLALAKTTGATPVTTTVKYCVVAGAVEVSDLTSVGDQQGRLRRQGTVSLDPAEQPMERTLAYSGTGTTIWLHLARWISGQSLVDVRTVAWNLGLIPPFYDLTIVGLAAGQCASLDFAGHLSSNNAPYLTEVRACRSTTALELSHASSIDGGSAKAHQIHGTIPLP